MPPPRADSGVCFTNHTPQEPCGLPATDIRPGKLGVSDWSCPRGGLDSRPAVAEGAPPLPQARRSAGDGAPREGELPALGSSPHLPQGDRPRPWQESDGHRAGLLLRRPLEPSVGGFLAQDGSSAGGGLNEDSVSHRRGQSLLRGDP